MACNKESDVQICFWIPETQKNALFKAAFEAEISASEYLRRLVAADAHVIACEAKAEHPCRP